ncbi:conserved hypothetical protein [Solidesulfovibrio fructosivorans JJ]]|uniref:Uncharacterized protein n=1 Tax=Solidesulfovibrio fructosivorans JJ] TaxID=596151 RepID=E1JZJ9_SOLFR|nr:hypothetical protein [Solidesulfovibrio fructosivorans]EFL50246.1 conserved hypothetical protein [Solidesulfovibrio fructosivorans JJ]]
MAGADDVMRSVGELGEKGKDIADAFSGNAHHSLDAARGLSDFFHKPDNLLALAVCLAAVIGLYRLLRAEGIIPAPRLGTGLAGTFLARRLALWLVVSVVTSAIGLALALALSSYF